MNEVNNYKKDNFPSRLEVSTDCTHDYVAVYDGPSMGSSPVAILCIGSSHTFTSSSNNMMVYFSSDNYRSGLGFIAYYYSLKPHHSKSFNLLPLSIQFLK